MQRMTPPDSAGFSRFDASIAPPLVAPAPITVDLVDEQDRVRQAFEFGDDLFQPFLEIAAIARAGKQRAHVERIDDGGQQHLGHVALDDLAREALGDRGLADAGIADIERVVLAAAAEDLDRAIDLGAAADQRVDLAALRLSLRLTVNWSSAVSFLDLPSFLSFASSFSSGSAVGEGLPPLPTPWLR
jgi:hypothetical protein